MKLHFTTLFVLIFNVGAFGNNLEKIHLSVLKSPSASVIDGNNHFVYELMIENQSSEKVHLKSLNLDGGSLREIKFDEAQINSRFKLLEQIDLDTVSNWLTFLQASQEVTPGLIPAGRSALIFLDINSAVSVKAPRKIRHSLTIDQGESQTAYTFFDWQYEFMEIAIINENSPALITIMFIITRSHYLYKH